MRGEGIFSFGPDRIRAFCKLNQITKIYRAHEMVQTGISKHYSEDLWTIFSASNYGGRDNNNGGVVIIDQEGKINFKYIYPLENPHKNWQRDENRPCTPPGWINAGGPRPNTYE